MGELKAEVEDLKRQIREEVNVSQRTRKEANLREVASQLVKRIGRG